MYRRNVRKDKEVKYLSEARKVKIVYNCKVRLKRSEHDE